MDIEKAINYIDDAMEHIQNIGTLRNRSKTLSEWHHAIISIDSRLDESYEKLEEAKQLLIKGVE